MKPLVNRYTIWKKKNAKGWKIQYNTVFKICIERPVLCSVAMSNNVLEKELIYILAIGDGKLQLIIWHACCRLIPWVSEVIFTWSSLSSFGACSNADQPWKSRNCSSILLFIHTHTKRPKHPYPPKKTSTTKQLDKNLFCKAESFVLANVSYLQILIGLKTK